MPIYAAVDIDDQYHERSQAELQRINTENLIILVPFPVYLEERLRSPTSQRSRGSYC
jgi:hypothetical protein